MRMEIKETSQKNRLKADLRVKTCVGTGRCLVAIQERKWRRRRPGGPQRIQAAVQAGNDVFMEWIQVRLNPIHQQLKEMTDKTGAVTATASKALELGLLLHGEGQRLQRQELEVS